MVKSPNNCLESTDRKTQVQPSPQHHMQKHLPLSCQPLSSQLDTASIAALVSANKTPALQKFFTEEAAPFLRD